MEGTNGININMGSPQTSSPDIGEVGIAPTKKPATTEVVVQPNVNSEPSSETANEPATNTDTSTHPDKTVDSKNNDQIREQEQPQQSQPEDELTEEQIAKNFDELWDNLDNKTKKRFAELLKKDAEKKEKKLTETSVEFLRALKVMFALLSLMISPFREQKDFYTGADLPLSDIPPEGRHLYKAKSDEQNPEESWNNFRKDVENMKQPMKFGEFMSVVLAANAMHSKDITIIKPEKEQKTGEKLDLLKSLIARNLGRESSQSARRLLSKPRGKPASVRGTR